MLQEKQKEWQAMLEEKERNRELELKRMEFEGKCRWNWRGGVRVAFGRIRSSDLPHFVDGKDDLDSYLLRFGRYATVAN